MIIDMFLGIAELMDMTLTDDMEAYGLYEDLVDKPGKAYFQPSVVVDEWSEWVCDHYVSDFIRKGY